MHDITDSRIRNSLLSVGIQVKGFEYTKHDRIEVRKKLEFIQSHNDTMI